MSFTCPECRATFESFDACQAHRRDPYNRRGDPKPVGELVGELARGQRRLEQRVEQRQVSDAQLAKLFVRRLYIVADQIAALNPDLLYKVAVRGLQRELWDIADEIEERLGR